MSGHSRRHSRRPSDSRANSGSFSSSDKTEDGRRSTRLLSRSIQSNPTVNLRRQNRSLGDFRVEPFATQERGSHRRSTVRSTSNSRPEERRTRTLAVSNQPSSTSSQGQSRAVRSKMHAMGKPASRLKRRVPSNNEKHSETSNNKLDGTVTAQEEDCAICFDAVELQGKLSCCSHVFCFTCIEKWSQTTNVCPMCKARFSSISKVAKDGKALELKQVKKRDARYEDYMDEDDMDQLVEEWLDVVDESFPSWIFGGHVAFSEYDAFFSSDSSGSDEDDWWDNHWFWEDDFDDPVWEFSSILVHNTTFFQTASSLRTSTLTRQTTSPPLNTFSHNMHMWSATGGRALFPRLSNDHSRRREQGSENEVNFRNANHLSRVDSSSYRSETSHTTEGDCYLSSGISSSGIQGDAEYSSEHSRNVRRRRRQRDSSHSGPLLRSSSRRRRLRRR